MFVLLANGKDTEPVPGKGKRWFALALLILMIVGATVGELPVVKEAFPEIKLDMFFFVSITTIIMAWTKIFPARKYTKYISWDILITIACAFAISKAMVNSGVADAVAKYIIGLTEHYGPQVLLAAVFIITNLFTELITNNAAAALAFPLALSISSQLGVSPMPFFVVICMAASASFSTPIGYQTNLIVQGIGNYKFTDFVRIGLPLNIITFLISIFLIPFFMNYCNCQFQHDIGKGRQRSRFTAQNSLSKRKHLTTLFLCLNYFTLVKPALGTDQYRNFLSCLINHFFCRSSCIFIK